MKLAVLSLANRTSVFGTTKTSRLGYLRRDLREHPQSHRWSFLTISTFLIVTLHHSRNFEHLEVYIPGVSKRSGTNRWTKAGIRLIPDRNSTSPRSVIGAVLAICPSPFFSSAALRRRKETDPQHGPCSCKSWPRRHKADAEAKKSSMGAG